MRWPHGSARHRRRSPLRRTPRRLSARGRHPVRVPKGLAPLGNAAWRCVATWTCEVSTVRRRNDRCVRSEMLHAARAARTNATPRNANDPSSLRRATRLPSRQRIATTTPPTAPRGTEGKLTQLRCHGAALALSMTTGETVPLQACAWCCLASS